LVAESRDRARYAREREAYVSRRRNRPDPAPSFGEMRDYRESYPKRRLEAIEEGTGHLYAERQEYRHKRAGQITCALIDYLPAGFPWGVNGYPKDAEVEAILNNEPLVARVR
jgi:hypothetical protein